MRAPTPVPGSAVWLRERRWRVERARTDRHITRLDLARQHQRLTVFTPFDRPASSGATRRVITTRRQHGRARLAHLLAAVPGARDIQSALDARIDLWPHQLEPAIAVIGGQRRILIADDVGLGKTIQAGVILAELLRRCGSLHALIVAPAGLCGQWIDELHSKFWITARLADRDIALSAGRSGPTDANLWHAYGVWVSSIDYIKQRHVVDGLPIAPWDLIVIDEAHGASGPSDRYDACDELGRRARHLVLLSATPHSGDESRYGRLLRMGGLPLAEDDIEVFRRTRSGVALPHQRVVRWLRVLPSSGASHLLDTLENFERAVLRRATAGRRDAALLLLAVFRKRALSTMTALYRSLTRRLEWLDASVGKEATWTQGRLGFDSADELDTDEWAALAADVGMPAAQERAWLRRLRSLAADTRRQDPKLAHLSALIGRTQEPVVIFTEFRDSLAAVQRALSPLRAVSVLHGGQPGSERRRELARFLSGQTSVLVATDVGGQGLNLQSRARWVINLELPWNPCRLEQRIGRVDRIGQWRRVHATLLITRHRAEDSLLASLARRALRARRAVDDTLLADVAPPSHLMVADAIFRTGSALRPSPVAHSTTLSTQYRRTARAMGVVLERRRRLIRQWRGHPPTGSRPVLVRVPWLPPRMAGLLVFSVSIVDRTGDLIERRLVGIASERPPRAILADPQQRRVLEAFVEMRALPRLVRLRHIARRTTSRRMATEQAIALHLHALLRPAEAQLGLFSHRRAVAFAAARTRAARHETDATARLRLEDAGAQLDSTAPSVEWIGERR